jgi:hypothetical protein
MVMRGAAPSATCPRCGAVSPPSAERLVHCATCKLSFDSTSEAALTRTRKRANTATEVERGPAGISLTKEPGEWTIRIPDQRIIGICYIVVGAALGAVFLEVKGYEGQELNYLVLLVAFALMFAYVGIAKTVSNLVVRIDERQLTATHSPLPLQKRVWIGRDEITKVSDDKTDSSKYPYVVLAVTPRGPIAIAGVRTGGRYGAEAAAFIAASIRDGLDATAPKPDAS